MIIKDFLRLDEYEQLQVISNDGVFILDYVQEDSVSKLYKLYAFFVKVTYDLPFHSRSSVVVFNEAEKIQLFHQKAQTQP
jgi:hypothetical protein